MGGWDVHGWETGTEDGGEGGIGALGGGVGEVSGIRTGGAVSRGEMQVTYMI